MELEPRQRTRLIARTVGTLIAVWVVLLAAFYLVPTRRFSTLHDFVRLGVFILIIVAVLAWQTRSVINDDFPGVRAVRALGTFLPLFLVVFGDVYLSMSTSSSGNFSMSLDPTTSLYFTITVLSTVGFGDITPHTDPARVLVSIQMLMDMVIIGVVVRLLIGAAKMGLARSGETDDQSA